MIIVAGSLWVDADQRDGYLDACLAVIEAARRAPGCVDFHLSADPVEPDRINVYEQWDPGRSWCSADSADSAARTASWSLPTSRAATRVVSCQSNWLS